MFDREKFEDEASDIAVRYTKSLTIQKYCESRLDAETMREILESYRISSIGIFDKKYNVITYFPRGFWAYIEEFGVQGMGINYPTEDIKESLKILWAVHGKAKRELLWVFLDAAEQIVSPEGLGQILTELRQTAEIAASMIKDDNKIIEEPDDEDN